MKLKNAFKSATLKTSNALKRKEGGTLVGNALRLGANAATKGILGNGVMMLKPGQSVEDANQYTKDALGNALVNAGVGISLANQTNDGQSLMDNTAPLMAKVKKLIFPILFGFGLIVTTLVLIFKRKKSN